MKLGLNDGIKQEQKTLHDHVGITSILILGKGAQDDWGDNGEQVLLCKVLDVYRPRWHLYAHQ